MAFLYETHMHTCQVSACGVSTGKEHVHFYRDAGYTGIIMTDHFFRGNTAVDRELPWKDRINWFWSGYEDAKAEGDKVGLDVFFGLEQNFAGDEYLVYGLTKEYMMEHPGVAVTRRLLLAVAWGGDDFISERVIDNRVKNLRKLLRKEGSRIKTLIGVGYRFD